MSYVTGGHQIKAGVSDSFGYLESTAYDYSPYAFFINIPGAPPFVRVINQKVSPLFARSNQDYDLGLFVQDRWSVKRATVNVGLRYDSLQGHRPRADGDRQDTVDPQPRRHPAAGDAHSSTGTTSRRDWA